MASFLQWNCRGLLSNYDDLNHLLEEHCPIAFCLQETYLKECNSNVLKHFQVFRKDRVQSSRTSGGVAVVVQRGFPCSEVVLQTSLEAVATRILVDRIITVCSLYIPPSHQLTLEELDGLVSQLPPPFLLLGDFNAHNSLWGSDRRDARGALIERFLLSTGLCLLNSSEPTYFSSTTRTFTSIDLSITHPTLFPFLSWKVIHNPYGSDHFPILLDFQNPPVAIPMRTPRWKFDKANWAVFKQSTLLACTSFNHLSVESVTAHITKHILEAALIAIPMTSAHLPKRPKPWWNDACRDAKKKQNHAWGIFRRYPTVSNLINFKRRKAQARYIQRESKRNCWVKYTSSINSRASPKEVWDRIHKITGSYHAFSVPLLSKNGVCPESLEEQADILGEHFEFVSSSQHYTPVFLRHKLQAEKQAVSLSGGLQEPYNAPFTLHELEMVLHSTKQSAPGPDRIHYFMLQHLHPATLELVLYLFNRIWSEGCFPTSWKIAVVIPLLKPGKDPTVASSYRPIALTSCLAKTLERMINRRLMYYLERHNLLDQYQCGFRAARSTVDHLVRFETTVREAFVNRQHCLSVFFDLEKAYDTAWRFGMLQDLFNLGFRGRILGIIKSYLEMRTFRVKLGSTFSRVFLQENGVPQGGVLSVTLFIIKMNSIAKVIPPSVQYSIYVDDVQVSVSSCNLAICERRVQLTVNNLAKWADQNGFKFSTEKTAFVCFSLKRGVPLEPSLTLYGLPIPMKNVHKFLGLIVDSKLSFIPHIKNLKVKCIKSLNILKVLSHVSWGADRLSLLHIYRSLIRSRLDYGCMVYGSARSSALKMLDPVHHQGLRLATGAFRTSPVQSLYADANELPLENRRFSLGFMYSLRTQSIFQHPTRHAVIGTRFEKTFNNKPSIVRPFSMRYGETAASFDLDTKAPVAQVLNSIAPWDYSHIYCDFTMTVHNKKDTPNAVLQQEFLQLKARYESHSTFYTDGTKSEQFVGCSMIGPSVRQVKRINTSATILTAELLGLILAVNYIIQKRLHRAVIYTDSLSSLKALVSLEPSKNPLVIELQTKLIYMSAKSAEVVLCWIPSHVGIIGNEEADRAASSAKEREVEIHEIPYRDYRLSVRHKTKEKWQSEWNNQINNKLHMVKPFLSEWESARHRERFYEVVLCRLRIGHTRLTHGHLLCGEGTPHCEHCTAPLSIHHILIECPAYDQARYKHFSQIYKEHIPLHLMILLSNEPLIPQDCVFSFLKEIGLLHRL